MQPSPTIWQLILLSVSSCDSDKGMIPMDSHMRRRQYLFTSVGLATTIGAWGGYGSAGYQAEDDEPVCPPDDGNTDAEGNGDPEIELRDHELVVEEDDFSTDAYISAEVANVGDALSGQIDLEADWYDDDGNYLDDNQEWLQTLEAGETWLAHLHHLGDSEDVADYELEMEIDDEIPAVPDGFVLEESEMQVGDRSAEIDGLVANETGDEISYIEAIAIIYDEDCVVLGSARTNETGIPAEETWAFDISWRGRDRIEEAAAHRIVLSD
ncbi:hypothetical protein GS429_01400 [Natronorubrum sp. JWXQ-INN-674]|uniref:Uncharacterized protein n=1 Tax=Natronorubrum halalkaliphilum TaxID=2691917 RepID=A0A6B0VI24_9EURY|nr:FxLYD domain-containing protein [Natronorubrum halalkaliphilum]MXV60747.1 hypothetical protein [Natronorubrum halalkaliphilum]